MDDKPKPGEQMARVDEATLREVVAETPPRFCVEGQTAPAQWPNTDPTLAIFYAPKENDKKGSTIKLE
jgi:hypothetical protein